LIEHEQIVLQLEKKLLQLSLSKKYIKYYQPLFNCKSLKKTMKIEYKIHSTRVITLKKLHK